MQRHAPRQGGGDDPLADTGGAWITVGSGLSSPAGTVSELCALILDTITGDAFEAHVAGAFLSRQPVIFEDGFESGDTSAWSVTLPRGPGME